MIGKVITIRALDGHSLNGYLASPKGTPKAGLVVLQEIFGVTAHMRRVTDEFAALGYLALAPALFDRLKPGTELPYARITEGVALMQQLAIDADAPRLAFAATLGTGALLRWVPGFPGCAADVPRLGQVPASVMAFTGYRIADDPFTALLGFGDYRPAEGGNPPPQVRNVLLPAQVSHVRAFEVDGYAAHPHLRAWIDAYQPGSHAPLPDVPGLDLSNLHHAADLWHSLKKHWALQARQWAAQRVASPD